MAMDIFYIEFLNVPPSESSKFDVDGLSDNFLKPSLVLIKKKKKIWHLPLIYLLKYSFFFDGKLYWQIDAVANGSTIGPSYKFVF